MFGKGSGGRRFRLRHRGGRDADVTVSHRGGGRLMTAPEGKSVRDMDIGTTKRIVRLCGCGPVRRRLLDMGFVPNADVTVVRAAPLMDPLEVRIGDSLVTIRRVEAAQIEVVDV